MSWVGEHMAKNFSLGPKGQIAVVSSLAGLVIGVLVGVFVVAGAQQVSSPPELDDTSIPSVSSSPEAIEPSEEPTSVVETAAPRMNIYRYRAISSVALQFYEENGMELQFDVDLLNGILSIEAPDEATADQIRMTFTDIRMWEKVVD